jgi:dipeptidyl aminopeptidase/acylaminoacyl peptidase
VARWREQERGDLLLEISLKDTIPAPKPFSISESRKAEAERDAGVANGWLVFEPNYSGSSGYGDDFMTQISPHIVSRPGKDILAGVDGWSKTV